MKGAYILSCFILIFSAFGEAEMIDGSLKKPPLLNINEKLYPLISNAEKSAMQGDIFKFYEQADKILPEIKNDLRQGMWLFYLVAAVPFIDDTVESNGEWLREHSDLDYEVKEKMILSFFPAEIRKSNGSKVQDEPLVMRELFLLYSSVILNQFRRESNPLFLYTYQYNRFLYLSNMDLRKDRDRFTKYCNYMNVRIGRQEKLNSIITNMEEDFVGMLVQFYPAKAIQVKRYLKWAGYGDDEIPDLLNRTMGRIPPAACLYKIFPQYRE